MSDPGQVATPDRLRVFFALWPDAPLRAMLHATAGRLHKALGGRRMRPETLHLTLVFIGDLAAARLPELLELAARIRVPACDIAFDRVDCWRRNHIAHLGVSQVPPPLGELVRQLEAGLEGRGVAFDQRAYVPHVTLLRNAECAKENPASEPIRWPMRDFVLVTSSLRSEGAQYVELGRWPLL